MSNNNSEFATGSALPFTTQDAILANCLRAAGFTESPISPLNLYTAEILFKLGAGLKDKDGNVTRPSRYAGNNIVEAARRAHKEGQRGRVEYHFEHHKDLSKFCQIYADQCREIESGPTEDAASRLMGLVNQERRNAGNKENPSDSFSGTKGSSFPDSPPLDPREIIMRVLCIALKLRIEFVNRWKTQTPYLVIKDQGTTQSSKLSDGGTLTTHPGGKMVPITAPDHTFKNLGVI